VTTNKPSTIPPGRPRRLLRAVLASAVVATGGLLLLAFTPPNAVQRQKAVGSLTNLNAASKAAFTDHGEFEAKKAPGAIDWLAQHKEKGQTYAQFIADKPNRPDSVRHTIYVVPLGAFDKDKAPSLKTLETFMQAYYHPMKVKVMNEVPPERVPAKQRVHHGRTQWNTMEILAWMKPRVPKDGFAVIAVTMTDLYPKDGWNFVFGQASFKQRVGVFSFARYHPSFYGEAEDKDTPQLVLKRAAKVLSHETGHMFGIRHCIHYQCNMNGVNHLQEADDTPMHLCPVCVRKLHWGLRGTPAERYRGLEKFYRDQNLAAEADWVAARLKRLGP